MKIILLGIFVLMSFNLFAQEKKNADSTSDVIMVADLDTTKFSSEINKWGCKVYYSIDSLGRRKSYMIGNESEFIGGAKAWINFLEQNLNVDGVRDAMPKSLYKKEGFKQTAEVEFTVCKDGSLCDFKILNDVHPAIKRETLRVISVSPNWLPGVQSGVTVKSRKRQRITFLITDN